MGVSVIIPVYNVKNYLNVCVESVVNQNDCNCEITISKVLYKGFNKNIPMFVCISAMMFSSVQFGSPMLSFILGYGMYNMHMQNTKEKLYSAMK